MKALSAIAAALIFLASCTKDNLASRNIVTTGETTEFKELILLIELKVNDSTSIALNSIDSVKIFINNRFWSVSSSDTLDISRITTTAQGDFNVSPHRLQYLVRAEKFIDNSPLNTAGGVANYLVNLYDLKAGEYACFIESIHFKNAQGVSVSLFPMEYKIFTVEENASNAFVGAFEFKI